MKYMKVALKTMNDGGLTEAPFEYLMGGGAGVMTKKHQSFDDLMKMYLDKVKKSFPSKS